MQSHVVLKHDLDGRRIQNIRMPIHHSIPYPLVYVYIGVNKERQENETLKHLREASKIIDMSFTH